MECSLAQVGANTAWTLIIASMVIAVGAATLVLSRRKAPALAMMLLLVGVVGAGAGGGTASAGSAACEPVCFDVGERDEEVPDYDLLLTSDDGVYFEGAVYQSTDGTCSGAPSLAGVGVIADTQEEAEALCEGDVTNLQATAPAGTTPLPAANLWGCDPD